MWHAQITGLLLEHLLHACMGLSPFSVFVQKAVADWKYQDAEKLLQLSVAAWPDNPKFSLALGDCLFLHLSNADGAIQWYVHSSPHAGASSTAFFSLRLTWPHGELAGAY